MEYRALMKEDIYEISELFVQLVEFIKSETEGDYFDFDNVDNDSFITMFEDILTDITKAVFVAVENGKIIGFIQGEVRTHYIPIAKVKRVGYINGAFILPSHRNMGVMKNLESILIDFFKAIGIEHVELNVLEHNHTAKECWKSLGYNTFRVQMRKRI
jgi:ribosomal protein S18 acetylase RimI-like enzyme